MPNTVSLAYARTNLPKLVKDAEKGKTIIISRYRKPVAVISPVPREEKPMRKFGTGKGKVHLIDPHVFDPMTDEEVDAFLEGRY